MDGLNCMDGMIQLNTNEKFFNFSLTSMYYVLPYYDNMDSYHNKSENLIFMNNLITSYDCIICSKRPEDNCIIINSYERIKEYYCKKVNYRVKKHIEHAIRTLKKNGYNFAICFSSKEILEDDNTLLSLTTEELKNYVEHVKSKWLIKNCNCSVINYKEQCSIDLEQYEKLIKTKCGHYFSIENLYEWIRNNDKDSCPLCRTILFDI